jgi:serine kinase of HPr protein (carbohydrate metabolism regulator)
VSETLLVHATAVAIDGEAILLRGPSGSGKSDLALRLIDGGGQLVADDQTLLRREGERVLASAPPAIAGLLEVRGVGVVRMAAIATAPLVLIADLTLSGDIERLPGRRVEIVLGRPVAAVDLAPFEASAPAKLRLLRRALAGGPLPAIIGA